MKKTIEDTPAQLLVLPAPIVDLIVAYAVGYLRYERENPDVGMGMFNDTAVGLAVKDVLNEARRWARSVVITEEMRAEAIEKVREHRERENL